MSEILRSCGTHDGTFHADEVTAVALLLLFDLVDKDKVVRSRERGVLESCEFVCDVGGLYDPKKLRFDHHQAGYMGPLSSAGMVLLYLMDRSMINTDLYHYLNRSLVMGIDAVDNGQVTPQIGHCTFSGVISNLVPVRYDPGKDALDRAFFTAVDFVVGHLKRLQERFFYIRECRGHVEEAMKESKECLMFDRSMPWMESFFELEGGRHPALFLIMPAGENWKLRGIPPSIKERMSVRHPLPKKWAGLLDDELKRVSGIEGAIFCHKGRFISVWETKEDALRALEFILRGRR